MPWYYVNDTGKPPEGPFQVRELADKFQNGEISGETYVWHRRKVRDWKQIKEIQWLEQKLSGVNIRVAQSSRGSVAEIFQEVPQLKNSPTTPNGQNKNPYRKSFNTHGSDNNVNTLTTPKRRVVNQRNVNTNKHRITPRVNSSPRVSSRNRANSAGSQRSIQARNSHIRTEKNPYIRKSFSARASENPYRKSFSSHASGRVKKKTYRSTSEPLSKLLQDMGVPQKGTEDLGQGHDIWSKKEKSAPPGDYDPKRLVGYEPSEIDAPYTLKQNDLVTRIQKLERENAELKEIKKPRPSLSRDEISERMVQIANLLCIKTSELEEKAKEYRQVLKEKHESMTEVTQLKTQLQVERENTQLLRRQWKKAQNEYEREIRQYQAQLDIFFAAETELNDVMSEAFSDASQYIFYKFSDEQSIQINLSYVE